LNGPVTSPSADPRAAPGEPPVSSPCIGICELDPHKLCVGCRRSIDEIVEWPRASAARQREILRATAQRTASAPHPT